MLGAIIGDIVGSVYEWNNIKTKDFLLFGERCFFTDDTVMTVATADAIMNGGERNDFINAYKKWGRRYPNAGYGGRFGNWLFSDDREPYNSWGNGSAMRVSPCAWLMDCGFHGRTGMWPSNAWEGVRTSADVTHNHPEGIKGAEATAAAIFLCRFYFGGWQHDYGNGDCCTLDKWKAEVKRVIEENCGYNLSRTLDEIRPTYNFNESCQETVPEAIIAFLESTDFEDAIRNAISLGGDSDTLAAITGSIAEAAYGIPDWIRDKALGYLDAPLREVYKRWVTFTSEVIPAAMNHETGAQRRNTR
jgi:ADP-ribosylglycohydrolase